MPLQHARLLQLDTIHTLLEHQIRIIHMSKILLAEKPIIHAHNTDLIFWVCMTSEEMYSSSDDIQEPIYTQKTLYCKYFQVL